ncbi:ATP-dependent DNA helicase mph1 [Frankliniella fusca]|uniref:ATP-dependent DNA helicase mph1 n=1 Tax=Frankliniella fusca TaxID=407009 RepID=A0AAE1LLT8_9NEOP|nr:ATP-dependent DNA helicase mph1 [Frankliniella fusca]KAK3922769.1 ATP-dependent DNA helicase mph1 [Frankliniella fusca]
MFDGALNTTFSVYFLSLCKNIFQNCGMTFMQYLAATDMLPRLVLQPVWKAPALRSASCSPRVTRH